MEAAFFDLDKTVIAKASVMAFARSFYQEGLLSRRTLARGLWTQVLFLRWGADAQQLARISERVLAVTTGWEQDRVRSIVADAMEGVIPPITYREALALIEEHRAAGRRVYIVSAAPAELVEPLARHLGVDEAIASEAIIQSGRYTGQLLRYAWGPQKAEIIRQVAERDGLDLTTSWAYSDSATDVPMLEAVGHPVAVNPDRTLRRIASMRGWPVMEFDLPKEPHGLARPVLGGALALALAGAAVTVAVGARRRSAQGWGAA